MSIRRTASILPFLILFLASVDGGAVAARESPWTSVDRFRVRELFESRQFTKLATLFEEYRDASEKDPAREYELALAIGCVSFIDHPEDKPLLEEWVVAMPGHWAPLLARANYFIDAGWRARGANWSGMTSESKMVRMGNNFKLAQDDLNRIYRMQPALVEVIVQMLEITHSAGDQEMGRRLVQEALKIAPGHYRVRQKLMVTLTPRWGGSYEAMAAFIKETEPFYERNPRLRFLAGYPDWDRATWEPTLRAGDGEKIDLDANLDISIGYYKKALAFGEVNRFLNPLAKAYLQKKQYGDASPIIEKLLRDDPNESSTLFLRAELHSGLGRIEEALRDLEAGERIAYLKKSFHGETAPEELVPTRVRVSNRIAVEASKLQRSDKQKAIEGFTQALRVYMKNGYALRLRGMLLEETGKPAEAFADLKEAVESHPKDFHAHLAMDLFLVKQSRQKEIPEYWNRYIELVPGDDKAYLERGGAYFHLQDFEGSYRDARMACKLGNRGGCVQADRLSGRLRKGVAEQVDAEVAEAGNPSAGRPPVRTKLPGGKWAFRDSKGEVITPEPYDDAWDFKNGLARVKRDDKWGYIDERGKVVIPFRFAYCWDFEGDRAKVRLEDGTTQFIGRDGGKVEK